MSQLIRVRHIFVVGCLPPLLYILYAIYVGSSYARIPRQYDYDRLVKDCEQLLQTYPDTNSLEGDLQRWSSYPQSIQLLKPQSVSLSNRMGVWEKEHFDDKETTERVVVMRLFGGFYDIWLYVSPYKDAGPAQRKISKQPYKKLHPYVYYVPNPGTNLLSSSGKFSTSTGTILLNR